MDRKKIKVGKIIIDRDLCIGASSCIVVSPQVFELDSENIAIIKKRYDGDDEEILLAAKSCPTNAIIILDENGDQIYP